jgi:hypothetical protein
MERIRLEENKVGEKRLAVYKYLSGLIFDDRFESVHPRWAFSPSDKVTQDSTGLTLEHSEGETLALFDIPEDEVSLLFEVNADYVPTQFCDEGGLVIWKDADNRLDLFESLHTTDGEYSSWRAHKKGNTWTFYAKKNGSWEIIDSAVLVASKMGIALSGSPSDVAFPEFVPLIAKSAILCRSGSLSVGNVSPGDRIELISETSDVVESMVIPEGHAGTDIPLPSIPFRGKIAIYTPSNELLSSSDFADIYGGDVYLYGSDLEVTYSDGTELSTIDFNNLGSMLGNIIEVKLYVKNPAAIPASEVTIGVLKYMEDFGYEWVDVAHDSSGSPGAYSDLLDIGHLSAYEMKPFWVRVARADEVFTYKPAHFIIDIKHI